MTFYYSCTISVQFSVLIGKLIIKAKLKALARSDERLRLIQEILSTIQIIKIYTWENYFNNMVDVCRK